MKDIVQLFFFKVGFSPLTANECMHELISKALMMTEHYLVTFDLLWHEIYARSVLLFVPLSFSLSLFTQHAPHLCLYPSFSSLFTPTIMIFIFPPPLSVSLSPSGTFFHVDQALLPGDLSFCSWSTIKQVSVNSPVHSHIAVSFHRCNAYGYSATVPQAKLAVGCLLPLSL